MTRIVYNTTMRKWDYSQFERTMEEFLPSRDPSDRKERTRLRIVRAAHGLFVRHGYRRTRVEEIAREAGVAKGTVYLYFKTKADLLAYVAAVEQKRYLSQLMPILKEEIPPRERLRLWLRTVFILSAEMPLISKLFSGDHEIFMVLEDMDAELRDRADEMRMEFLTEMLDLAAAPHQWTSEELRDRVQVLRGILRSSLDERVLGGLSPERFAGIFADMIVDGVGRSQALKPAGHE